MPRKPRTISVSIRWERSRDGTPRVDETGRGYAILRWTEADGSRPTEPIGYRTEAEAEQLRIETESRLRLGMTPSAPSSSSATVSNLCALLIRDMAERGLATRGIEMAADRLACVKRHLGNHLAEQLDDHDIVQYVAARRRDTGTMVERVTVGLDGVEHKAVHRVGGGKTEETPRKSTVHAEVNALRHAYRLGKKRGLVTCDPPAYPSFKGWEDDERPMRELTEPEVETLLAECYASRAGESFGRLIQFMAWCPRRPVAIWGLRRKDCIRMLDPRLERDQQLVFFAKDKAGIGRGWGPITEPAREALLAQLAATTGEPDDLVWTSRGGRKWYPALIFEPFKFACARAKVEDVQIYDLRKFGCSAIFDRVWNLYTVQKYSGHRDIRALSERYISASKVEAAMLAGTITWRSAEPADARDAKVIPLRGRGSNRGSTA